ncbi:MAG: fused MFS/spermidine synthase [Hyphomicrobiales bacterium]
MAIQDVHEQAGAKGSVARHTTVLAVFMVTLFTSALLLFGVQPMFAKMVLPKLGGSAAVWSVALVFFQSVLLLGYAYAHLLTSVLRPRLAVIAHLVVLAGALTMLPIAYPAGWDEVPQSGLQVWVLSAFAVGVGVPFFAVSASAPLLQYWFSKTGHPHGRDPYFLYGASNIGSFAALLLYPFLLEPLLPLGTQSFLWSAGYVLLGAMIVACGLVLWFMSAREDASDEAAARPVLAAEKPAMTDRLWWIALAMVPSGLLVGVTAYVTTDLVAAPFLWVLPLALFLLTFVITFQRNPVLKHTSILRVHSLLVATFLTGLFTGFTSLLMVILHLAVFFVSAMVCHGELVRRRPHAEHLTEFYLWMSFGGVLGGLFAGLIAPHVFSQVLEYPILLFAVYLVRKDTWSSFTSIDRGFVLSLAVLAVVAAGLLFEPTRHLPEELRLGIIALMVVGIVLLNRAPLAQSGFIAASLFVVTFYGLNQKTVERVRSFYGVNAVLAQDQGRYHLFTHGTTIHGAQRMTDDNGKRLKGRPEPLTYFQPNGPIAGAIDALRAQKGGLGNVAVVGLGAGTMACYRKPGETWKYYEIDPAVVEIARDPRYFNFLSECGESEGIDIGDGRLMVSDEPNGKFDVIMLDAFSSDSVPVHLVTKEAMALYFSKLKPNGVLMFNISNRYMELGSVIASIAKTHGAMTHINLLGEDLWAVNGKTFKLQALVAVVSRTVEDAGSLPSDPRWFRAADIGGPAPWTDDYSNVLASIYRRFIYGLLPPRHPVQAHGARAEVLPGNLLKPSIVD